MQHAFERAALAAEGDASGAEAEQAGFVALCARVAATYASIGAVFGEYAGSTDGLGYVMILATPMLQTSLVFAAIALLSLISICLFLMVTLAERILVPWAKVK